MHVKFILIRDKTGHSRVIVRALPGRIVEQSQEAISAAIVKMFF